MRTRSSSDKSGSALLLTLLVVSLMLAIVLSYTVYVRMELRRAQNRIHLVRARHNAKLAMHLALNKLQVAAGPDQRVTARAEILGDTVTGGNRFWTGVWERDPGGGVLPNPAWLVSGVAASPLAAVGSNAVELHPGVNGDPAVRVPLEDARDDNGNIVGRVGYWVADKGVKASVVARRQGIEVYENAALKPDRQRVEYQTDFGVDLTVLLDNPSVDLTDTDLPSILERATYPEDLLLVDDSGGQPFTPAGADLPVHDLTLLSLGVLENPQDGGLRKNVSDPAFRDSFLITDETAAFLAPKGGFLNVEYRDPVAEGIQPGEPFFSPRPVLTEAMLQVGLFWNDGDSEVKTRHHLNAELFNPYTLPIRLDVGQYGEVTLVFENLPTLTISAGSGPGNPYAPIVKDMDEAKNRNDESSTGYYSEIRIDPVDGVRQLLPGEFYEEIGPTTLARGLARSYGVWTNTINTIDRPTVTVSGDHGNDPLIVKLVHPSYSGINRNVGVLQEVSLDRTNLPFQLSYTTDWSNFYLERSGDYTINDYSFAYHYRLWSDDTDPRSMRDYLTRVPILDPTQDSAFPFTDTEGTSKTLADHIIPYAFDARLIQQNGLDEFDKQDLLKDKNAGGHDTLPHRMFLIDVPDGEDLLSVGALTSLPIYRHPPRVIGSPWGGDLNKAFDRYYFSPKRMHPDPNINQPILVSPVLTHLDNGSNPLMETPDENDAENEMVLGRFNLNSTSVVAWEAALRAPILTPQAADEGGADPVSRPATFVTLPHYQADAGNDFVVTDAEIQNADNAFAQGLRALHPPHRDSQVRQLAENIVAALKTRQEPFPNLEELANSGILQQAIDDIDSANGGASVNDGIVEFSNLYLTQNAVLAKLAPTASTRSDSFVIRAYGNVLNPNGGGRVSEAFCEAVVQRVPAKMDGSNPMDPSVALTDAREFRILSFRWLNNEES